MGRPEPIVKKNKQATFEDAFLNKTVKAVFAEPDGRLELLFTDGNAALIAAVGSEIHLTEDLETVMPFISLREALREWIDYDRALYFVARNLGLVENSVTFRAFRRQLMTATKVATVAATQLKSMVDSGLIEQETLSRALDRPPVLRYRWSPV